ncbi:hypothetical protein [Gelidibacter salicanalis]|nr:hypothetical protein [Gelidibacter salicanalis]
MVFSTNNPTYALVATVIAVYKNNLSYAIHETPKLAFNVVPT